MISLWAQTTANSGVPVQFMTKAGEILVYELMAKQQTTVTKQYS